ncbi:MAG: Organic solvent tolerance protein OstA [Acidobacteria bacterium]|nr:Organic solvent tolerance protein OstA [Acidobacteriota bacterium]
MPGIRVASRQLPFFLCIWLFAATNDAAGTGYPQSQTQNQPSGQVRTEISYPEGKVVLLSDSQERFGKSRHRATGHVLITYQDLVITCDGAEYDEATQEGVTTGPTRFSQGRQWLTCSRAEFDLGKQTATLHDATGFTDQEFLLMGQTVRKIGRDRYVVDRGSMTACLEQNPKWAFQVGNARIRVDQTAQLRRVLFKIKGIPVFYFPYLVIPMETKKRSSGFLPFHTGTSDSKGRQFSLGYFHPLGPSADITFYGDYFSLRGMGYGGIFRARPNQTTDIRIEGYGVDDRQGQGGAHLVVDAESRFKNGFRTVAAVNVTTNFMFRQAFSEGFRSATTSEERSLLFATNNHGNISANFAFQREEVFFPARSLVIRNSPSMEFRTHGKQLGRLPLIFYFRAAAEGLSRSDIVIETPRIVQRLDFHPRLALRLPSFAGFSIVPSAGIRETYYSARITRDAIPEVIPTPLRRQYTELQVEMRTPELEKAFHSQKFGNFQHHIEPMVTYRRIHGITEMREIIRFDDQDAIADTNELEYGIVNRIVRKREKSPGISEDYEFFSIKIAQKYYFDPDFGGAFLPGQSNQFYPLYTLTGFSATGISRSLAPTTISMRLTPRPGVSYDVHADYDTRLARLRDASVSAQWQQEKLFIAGTYFKTNAFEAGDFNANHIQSQIGYGLLDRGFSASLTVSYDLRTRTLLNSNSRLNYAWNCCGIALQYQQFDLGLRIESRITFSFSLKGIGNFGNLKRPESLF